MSLEEKIKALASSIASDIKTKQPVLINENNVKSINNKNLLGNGKITILGSRTFVFGGTGTPAIGSNLLPLSCTNFYGIFRTWRLTVKNAPFNGSFVLRLYSSTSEELTDKIEVLTVTLNENVKTVSGSLNNIIANNKFLSLDIISVNQVSDWKLEIRQDELEDN